MDVSDSIHELFAGTVSPFIGTARAFLLRFLHRTDGEEACVRWRWRCQGFAKDMITILTIVTKSVMKTCRLTHSYKTYLE